MQQLSKIPIELDFKKSAHKNDLKAKDASGQLVDLKHTSIKQTEEEDVFHRIGIGSFEFQGDKIDYLVSIAANPSNPDHKYLYLAHSSSKCNFLRPQLIEKNFFRSAVSKLKDKTAAGHASKGTDMTR